MSYEDYHDCGQFCLRYEDDGHLCSAAADVARIRELGAERDALKARVAELERMEEYWHNRALLGAASSQEGAGGGRESGGAWLEKENSEAAPKAAANPAAYDPEEED